MLQFVTAGTASDTSAVKEVTASCPSGQWRASGGGVERDGPMSDLSITMTANEPTADDSGWHAAAYSQYTGDWVLRAYPICVNVE